MGIWWPYPLSNTIRHKSGVLSEISLPPAMYIHPKLRHPLLSLTPLSLQSFILSVAKKVQCDRDCIY